MMALSWLSALATYARRRLDPSVLLFACGDD